MDNFIFTTSTKKLAGKTPKAYSNTLWGISVFAPLNATELLTIKLSPPPLHLLLLIVIYLPAVLRLFILKQQIRLSYFLLILLNSAPWLSQIGNRLKVLFLFGSKNSIVFTIRFTLIWGAATLPLQII